MEQTQQKTRIFKDCDEFLRRTDWKENGMSQEFANEYPEWEKMNETNEGCWNCSGCSSCSGCSGCSDCSRCSRCSGQRWRDGIKDEHAAVENKIVGFPPIPVIKDIHQKIFEAVSQPAALDMSTWHTCDTTHCRAGWVVTLAGEEGRVLERHTSTQFAAMQIYKASSPIR